MEGKEKEIPVPATDADALTVREAFTVLDLVLHGLYSSCEMSWCTIACFRRRCD